ncbi:MAG: hypothetical protein AAF762_01680 [Pseudomonadota bacterium]
MPPRHGDAADPRGLIYEAYRIDGINRKDCRTIFLDWAIGVPAGEDERAHIDDLLSRHGTEHPDHPMTAVLEEAKSAPRGAGRRGGAKGRRAGV